MNTALEQTILERLHALDDTRLAEVLEFVESLACQPQPVPSRHARLARECAKLDPRQERECAETAIEEDMAAWPEY